MSTVTGPPGADDELPVVTPTVEQLRIRNRLQRRIRRFSYGHVLDEVRSSIESRQDRVELDALRGDRDVVWVEETQPLVTVRIATYNAGPRLATAVDSALRQTYPNLDVLIVGDHCDAATADVAQSYTDPRVRFVNLPRRGQYPDHAPHRWMVAGSTPMNVGLDLALGAWIAPCDDDDMMTDDHVDVLLSHATSHRLELVWSRAALQQSDGTWRDTGNGGLALGRISHGTVLYSAQLRFIRHNRRSYLAERPGDWDLWRRMGRAGVKSGFLDRRTYYHFA
jgi:hypothetical protein